MAAVIATLDQESFRVVPYLPLMIPAAIGA